MTKEQKFYKALEDVFIGAKIEGEGGFVNLMRIKSSYYSKIKEHLEKDIEKALKKYPKFREELFDKLYSFFSRYFTKSGSIYFNYTPFFQNVYDKVYTDDKDVILFWKTRMLYYVKTDRIFKNLKIEIEDKDKTYQFFFDVSHLEYKKANEKKDLIYEFNKVSQDNTIFFNVFYSEKGKQTNYDDIKKKLKQKGLSINDEILDKAFSTFEAQSEVDYFINKNAKEFLQEQFKIWLYQYIYSEETEWSKERIDQLQILKDIAFKIIDFISQFEDELVKIWNKPKFVLNSNYVITLDRIAKKNGFEIIEKIQKHKNFKEQIKEWKELGILEKEPDNLLEKTLTGLQLKKEYQFLPIDTKYFKDLELKILSLFDNLDQSLDGWLIKSENYQALNTILPKFSEKVQTIYIDPPYNTGSDDFVYNDKFQHSSWLTMMENRLNLGKEIMNNEGVVFISIGDTLKTEVRINSTSRLQSLCNYIFNEDNFIATFVRKSGTAPRQDIKHIANSHDYVICYSKDIEKAKINKKPADISRLKYEDEYINYRGNFDLNQLDRGSKQYSESLDYAIVIEKGEIIEVFNGHLFQKIPAPEKIEIWPGGDPNDKRWIFTWSREKVKWGIENGFIVFRKDKNGKWRVYYKEYELVDNENQTRERTNPYDSLILEFQNEIGTSEIENLFGRRLFEYPKPSDLIKYLLQIGSNKNSLILDFFAGSGTTAHAVMKLNKEDGGKRKFILVEIGDYFNTVIIPRIKKVAYSFNWKDGKAQDADEIGVFFKYYELEQYEDVLRKAKYEDSDLFSVPNQSPYEQYIFLKDKKLLDALEIDYKDNKVKVDLSKIYSNIDIAETISNLNGKWIKRITENEVELADYDEEGKAKNIEKVDLKNLDYKDIKKLIWW